MAYSIDDLQALIRSPRETLDTELKAWIDPATPDGAAKIARGCMALRNNNGGCLIIGFTDAGTPDVPPPPDVRKIFHNDVVQGIVTKYASHSFEVRVEFVERGGVEYPVLCVGSGVETPVAAKSDLPGANGKPLIRTDAVYVRSLDSNNTVSTTAARWKDWDRLVRICFENREADIGAFIRRHLSGVQFDRLGQLISRATPDPSPLERAVSYLNVGRERFEAACADRKLQLPPLGTREAAIVIAGEFPAVSANEELLHLLQSSKPQHTGWTPWIDSRRSRDESDRPYVFDGAWEALLAEFQDHGWGTHLDFWRIAPKGLFYCLRGLEDDLPHGHARKPPPLTQLDFLLQISRLAEIISIGLSFARALRCPEKESSLAFAFRWSGLRGRSLTSWVEPQRSFHSRGSARQDVVTTQVLVPLEVPPSGIAGHVEAAVAPLFELFDGTRFEPSVVEGIVQQTISRHL